MLINKKSTTILLLKYDAEITGAEVIVNGLLFFQKKILHEK